MAVAQNQAQGENSSLIIWIILGVVLAAGVGLVIYNRESLFGAKEPDQTASKSQESGVSWKKKSIMGLTNLFGGEDKKNLYNAFKKWRNKPNDKTWDGFEKLWNENPLAQGVEFGVIALLAIWGFKRFAFGTKWHKWRIKRLQKKLEKKKKG